LTIKRGDNSTVSENFKRSEFYSRSAYAPKEHDLASILVDAAQLIRDYYGKPVVIKSSWRTSLSNRLTGGAKKSMHLKGCAIDLDIAHRPSVYDINKQFKARKGELFEKLRALGITGFGVYGNKYVHIDCRRSSDHTYMTERVFFGAFEFWDKSKKKQ